MPSAKIAFPWAALILIALTPHSSLANRGAAVAREDNARTATYLHRYLDEERQSRLWSSEEILPGISKRSIPSGLLMDILAGPGLDSLAGNFLRRPTDGSTDPASLFALSRIFGKMRVLEEAWPDRKASYQAIFSIPDSARRAPVLILAVDYDRIDWRGMPMASNQRGLPLEKGFFFCASAPPQSGGKGPITVEFSAANVWTNRPLGLDSVEVVHNGISRTVAFPGKLDLLDFDPQRLLICNFTLGKETLTAYLDLAPR